MRGHNPIPKCLYTYIHACLLRLQEGKSTTVRHFLNTLSVVVQLLSFFGCLFLGRRCRFRFTFKGMFDNNSIRGYIMAWASNSDRVHGLMTDNLGLDRFTYKCAANKGNHWRPLGSKRLWPRDKMGLVTAGNGSR